MFFEFISISVPRIIPGTNLTTGTGTNFRENKRNFARFVLVMMGGTEHENMSTNFKS